MTKQKQRKKKWTDKVFITDPLIASWTIPL